MSKKLTYTLKKIRDYKETHTITYKPLFNHPEANIPWEWVSEGFREKYEEMCRVYEEEKYGRKL